VFVGSPADGELHRGDAILGINGYDASNMIHKQAQDLIKNAGGTINLIVRK
jgi:C-terminal processing protease CtpA/Prc